MTIDLSDAYVLREKKFFVVPVDLPKMVMDLFAAGANEMHIDAFVAVTEPVMDDDDGEEKVVEYMITAQFDLEEEDGETAPMVTEKKD